MTTWSRHSVLNFIKQYRSHECLWKRKSLNYNNRELKEKAYTELLEFTLSIQPDADKDFVIKKIQTLRSSYRKQFRKLKLAKMRGADKPPSLWYFHALAFLQDQEITGKVKVKAPPKAIGLDPDSLSETHGDSEEETDLAQMIMEPKVKTRCSPSDTPTQNYGSGSHSTSSSRPTPAHGACPNANRKRKLDHFDACAELLTLVRDKRDDDQFDCYGKTIAYKLRNVSREQNIHAQKLISDILYAAELGSLSRGTFVCNKEED